jgi:hypothetical protein
MNATTAVALQKLKSQSWFASVGSQDLLGVKFVSSWMNAIAHCAGVQWENVQIEAQNQLTEELSIRHRERYREWNRLVQELGPTVRQLVEEKTREVVAKHGLPKVFVDSVYGDLLGFTMECEYSDVVPPGFCTRLAECYLAGHFPCGWEGEFPEGRLIVY